MRAARQEQQEGKVNPFWSSHNGETTLTIYQGDVLAVLRRMPAESVHCVVTSPPYWGLRDYKTEPQVWPDGWRGSLGLEPMPDLYVQHLVEIFREVRRVLRRDGTLWLNMGDSYAAARSYQVPDTKWRDVGNEKASEVPVGLKPKDLLGMPWRVAFALQADGWWLRSDIIWSKPNPMPESVTDRPTKAHEYLFLLAKAERYFYDGEAIKEPIGESMLAAIERGPRDAPSGGYQHDAHNRFGKTSGNRAFSDLASLDRIRAGRNRRTVWTIATEPFPEAHFAVYPQKLVEPCILAGTSEKGCCPECGAPWERVTEPTGHINRREPAHVPGNNPSKVDSTGWAPTRQVVGWQPTCAHDLTVIPCTVLDPFLGSGTTLLVAQRLGRNGIGIELSEDYCRMAVRRIEAEHSQVRLGVT